MRRLGGQIGYNFLTVPDVMHNKMVKLIYRTDMPTLIVITGCAIVTACANILSDTVLGHLLGFFGLIIFLEFGFTNAEFQYVGFLNFSFFGKVIAMVLCSSPFLLVLWVRRHNFKDVLFMMSFSVWFGLSIWTYIAGSLSWLYCVLSTLSFLIPASLMLSLSRGRFRVSTTSAFLTMWLGLFLLIYLMGPTSL